MQLDQRGSTDRLSIGQAIFALEYVLSLQAISCSNWSGRLHRRAAFEASEHFRCLGSWVAE